MLATSFVTPLDEVSSTDKEGVGKIRFQGGKWYKWCKLQNTTATVAVVAGDAVAYDAEDGHRNSHVVSDLTDAGTKPCCAGTVCGTVAGVLATAYYCWVQIKGAVTVAQAIANSLDGTPVAAGDGDPIILSTSDKVFRRQNTVIDADAERTREVGQAIDASAKYVILDCPF